MTPERKSRSTSVRPAKAANDGPTSIAERGPDFVEALARGLDVLGSFGVESAGPKHGRLTLSEVAERTNLSRGTARRMLLTLRALKYVDTDGRVFWLTPKVLNFSNAYLTPLGLGDAAKAIIKALTDGLNESSSIGVLDGPDVVYVARMEVRRLYSSGIDVGTRLPAHCSSLGQVLLAALNDEQLNHWLAQHELTPLTPRTITEPEKLRRKLLEIRRQQVAIVDGELEIGIRSVAVPIIGRSGHTFAALNASTSTARVSLDTLSNTFVPALRKAAHELSGTMDW
jgi:IclR family pca regulon transcriptional regulator